MAELKQDPLANDGVSCTACHQIKPDNFGTQQSYSGNYIIEADSILYGPYEDSDTTLMCAIIGYKSEYSLHMNQSELCATCHISFTPTMNAGNHLWAERYDRELKDFFAIQDEVTMKILTSLQVTLTKENQPDPLIEEPIVWRHI